MSARGLKNVASVATCAIGLVFASTAAQSERARSAEPTAAIIPVEAMPAAETPHQRRQHLNARMTEMLRSGKGARLVQPPALRRRAPTSRIAAVAPAELAAFTRVAEPLAPSPTSPDEEYRSTIAPPAFSGGTVRRVGRGYNPPRLDLATPPRIPGSAVECLTQAIYYEARNESAEGQAAVAEVVMNRSRSGAYPSSVCAVVYQRNSRTCQFTFTCDGAIGRYPVDLRKWARAESVAREVFEGRSTTLLPSNSVNYHANYVRPSWGARLERVRQIGAHIFYGASLTGDARPGATVLTAAPRQTGGLVFTRNTALDEAYARAMRPGG